MKVVGKLVCLTDSGVKHFEQRGSTFSQRFMELIGSKMFTIDEVDDQGNVIAITCEDKTYRPNTGLFEMVWCFFLAGDVRHQIQLVNPGVSETGKEERYWVITIPANQWLRPATHGPYTKEEADQFAINQIKGGIDGTTVLVTKVIGEAKATYEVKEV